MVVLNKSKNHWLGIDSISQKCLFSNNGGNLRSFEKKSFLRKGIGTHWCLNIFFASADLEVIELVLNGYRSSGIVYIELKGNSVKINIHLSLSFLYKLGLGLGKVEN